MAIDDDELKVLVNVTGTFESSGDPYVAVSGNFDGQGISCGVLQWNIGQGSLQPLVKAVGEPTVRAAMPAHGNEMWNACHVPIGQGLAIVKSWQVNNALRAAPKAELRSLMGSPEMRARQNVKIREAAAAAEKHADAWASARGGAARTLQELAWFFDVVTQNGSMKGITFAEVQAFKQAAGPGRADDLVCDWLESTNGSFAGKEDCHKNAALWRDRVSGAALDLFVLSYLRSQKSVLKWRGDVLNRKGTLAAKTGWVHKTRFDFSGVF